MLEVFRQSCGVDSADDVVRGRRGAAGGAFSQLANLIVAGRIVSIRWNGNYFVPLFPFEPGRLSLRPGVRPLLDALGPGFAGGAATAWFASANAALEQRRPVDVLLADLAALLDAASEAAVPKGQAGDTTPCSAQCVAGHGPGGPPCLRGAGGGV